MYVAIYRVFQTLHVFRMTQQESLQIYYLTSSKVILNPCCGLRIVALRNASCTAAPGDRAHDRFTEPSL